MSRRSRRPFPNAVALPHLPNVLFSSASRAQFESAEATLRTDVEVHLENVVAALRAARPGGAASDGATRRAHAFARFVLEYDVDFRANTVWVQALRPK